MCGPLLIADSRHAENRVDHRQAGLAGQHQFPPAQAVDGDDGHEGEHEINDARGHDVQQHLIDAVAAGLKISSA